MDCCARCGFPFELDAGPDAFCGACTAEEPAYDRARAAVSYDDLSRTLVLDIKRGARRDGLKAYAAWMRLAGGPLVDDADMLIPTPLHWTRLIGRRFNQAAVLAETRAQANRLANNNQLGLIWTTDPRESITMIRSCDASKTR